MEIATNDCVIPNNDRLEYELIILDASNHIKEMRNYANNKMHELLQDKIDNKPWKEMQDVFSADYSQNLECPYFGSLQLGDTYYFSPISILCFRVSNIGLKDHPLWACLYLEGEGKNGGNIIASLLMKHLVEMGCTNKTKGPQKELTVIMDNCGGQNKNQMVWYIWHPLSLS